MDDTCVMCAIAEGRSPARLLYSDEDACSFLDVDPVRVGHALVIPRRHVEAISEEGAAPVLAGMAAALHVTGRLLVEPLGAPGLSVFQANGAAAGQTVFHVHFHLVPRLTGDDRLTRWSPDEEARSRLDETYQSIMRSGGPPSAHP